MKSNKKALNLMVGVLFTALLAGGCGKDLNKAEKYVPAETVRSDTLYVEKVENMPDDFILGMDVSSVISLEAGGTKYYGFDGTEEDLFKLLRDNGVNYIRVRVWNDPFDANGNGYGGGNCNAETAVEIGKRATKYGLKLLVDFHYSDFWADPAKQMCPKAWEGMDIETKSEALYEYTKDTLTKLKEAGVDVGMVQLGNETNGKMAGETIWMNIIYHLMGAGSRATREVFPEALVAVHFANPEKAGSYEGYAKKLDYYALDYDVFASSYYPFWHGTLDNLSKVLSDVAVRYNKKVMVAETSYAFTPEDTDFFGNTISDGSAVTKNYPYTIQGQANSVRDVVDTVVNKTTNGIGVFYWEGAWITAGGKDYEANLALWEKNGSGWASTYSGEYDPDDAGKWHGGSSVDNQTFFDAKGKAIESLKVFGLLKSGNEVALRADAVEDTNLIIDLNGEIKLPATVNAVMNDNSKQAVSVTWNNVDEKKMKSNGAAKYDITGTAGGMEAHCYVSMVEYNFLKNYSFEDGDDGSWVAVANKNMNQLYIEDKATDSLTGTKHYHFWSEGKNTVDFDLEQEVKDLPAGTYTYLISLMGGDCGKTNVYAYVKINDKIIATEPAEIKGYNNWQTPVIKDIKVNAGDKITVGLHVTCEGEGNGAWGKIDDALLNSVAK